MLSQKIKRFLIPTANYLDNRSYRRILMTNFVLIAILVSTAFFFFLNLHLDEYLTAGIDFFGFVISIYALYQLQVHHDLQRTSFITTASFTFFLSTLKEMMTLDLYGVYLSLSSPSPLVESKMVSTSLWFFIPSHFLWLIST